VKSSQRLNRRSGRNTSRKKKPPVILFVGLAVAFAVVFGATLTVLKSNNPQSRQMKGYKKAEKTDASTTTIPGRPAVRPPVAETASTTFKDISDFAKENPDAYGEIIEMYRKISKSTDNENDRRRAVISINSLQKKWAGAAAEALDGVQNNVKAHLAALQFGMAEAALEEFPISLLHRGVADEIEKVRLQINEAKVAFISELKTEGEPLLKRVSGDLSREDLTTLNSILKRTKRDDLGLTFRQAREVGDFSKRVSTAVSRHRAHAGKLIALKDQFWDSYRHLIRSKQFEQARNTVHQSEALSEEERNLLAQHTSVVEKSLVPASRNLPIVKALYEFYFGDEAESISQFRLASKSGEDVRLYLDLLGADLPEWMRGVFEIPDESSDSHGNTIRTGVEKPSGLPHEVRHKSSGIHFVLLPAGQFRMGSLETEQGRKPDEGPVHSVEITRPFYMGKYEITGADWRKANGAKFVYTRGEDFPLTKIRKLTAMMFASQLSRQLPLGRIRLPTEAEWEYACRAGSTAPMHYGSDPEYTRTMDYGWFKENSGGKVRPAGMKKPNRWGLYDMIGNVWEFVLDNYDVYPTEPKKDPYYPPVGNDTRTIRGGGVLSPASQLRSAARSRIRYAATGEIHGFRLMVEHPRREPGIAGLANPVFKNMFTSKAQDSWVRSGDAFFNWGSGLGWTDGGPGGIVYTAKKFRNFILRFDCLASDLVRSDAGISFPVNGPDITNDKTENTFEIELSGTNTGTVFYKGETFQSTELPLQPGWNSIELVVWEREVFTTREGAVITHWQRPSLDEGFLTIEGAKQQFCFRNFRILELQQKPAALIKRLAEQAMSL